MKNLLAMAIGTILSCSAYAEQQQIIEGGDKERDKSIEMKTYEKAKELVRETCDAECRERARQNQRRQSPADLGRRG